MSIDAAKISSNPLEDLPDYLGLGILDSSSLDRSHDKVMAVYKFENEDIYQVSISDKSFQIVELMDGQVIATTAEKVSLKETFFHHLISQPPYKSKRFERLFHRLADNRNVIVRFAPEPRFLYYPAGYLFTLRQPVVSNKKLILDGLAESIVDDSDPSSLKFDSMREGVILRLLRNGEITVEKTQLADFSSTLHRLASAVDAMLQSGVVSKEKEYQLMVLDSSMSKSGNMSIYLSDVSSDFITFSVIVTEGDGLELEQMQNNFRDSSFQLLENLKKQKK